jgi:hypothetical protein
VPRTKSRFPFPLALSGGEAFQIGGRFLAVWIVSFSAGGSASPHSGKSHPDHPTHGEQREHSTAAESATRRGTTRRGLQSAFTSFVHIFWYHKVISFV